MSSQPFMQFYVGDYLADTTDLTCEEHGAYLLLLMTMWRHGAKLPNDAQKLARVVRVTPRKWTAIWQELSRFFEDDGEHITNRRLTREHQKAVDKSELRTDAGRKGGDAKSLKERNLRVANAMPVLKHSSEPEPELREIGKPISCASKQILPDQDFQDFWDAYPHRQGKKKNRKGAETAFGRAVKDGATIAEIAAGVEAMHRDPDVIRGYARDPTTWLNQRGWTDEIPEQPKGPTDEQGNSGIHSGRGADRRPSGPHHGMVAAFADVAARRSGRA